MKIKLYNQQGEEKGEITLNKEIFEYKINPDLIHQAVVMIQANRRNAIAHTKKQGEISTTTKKPFRQKGTGRARQGGTRKAHHRKGAVAFGPRNTRNFSKDMPKTQRRMALFSALSSKAKEGNVLALDKYENEPKTKLFAEMIKKLPIKRDVLVVTNGKDPVIFRAARNMKNVETVESRNLNVEKICLHRDILFLQDALKSLETTFLKAKA